MIFTAHQLEDRRKAGENSCNSDGTDQTGPILDVYDGDDDHGDDDDDDDCSPNTNRVIKARGMNYSTTGKRRSAYRVLVGRPEGKR